MLVLFDLGLSDETRFDLFPETIRVALDVNRCRVMKDPVEDGRGDHRIPEDFVPLREASIRGQDQRPLLISAGDKLKKEMRAMTIDRDVTDLIDDQEPRLAVELQSPSRDSTDVSPWSFSRSSIRFSA